MTDLKYPQEGFFGWERTTYSVLLLRTKLGQGREFQGGRHLCEESENNLVTEDQTKIVLVKPEGSPLQGAFNAWLTTSF